MRTCKICKQEKEDHDFQIIISKTTGKEYFRKACRVCTVVKKQKYMSDYRLRYKYGITQAQWELILKSQNGKCKLCSREFGGKIKIDVDHNHKTHIVRGLLCTKCNVSLGGFNDDPERLREAANYLETSNALKELYSCKS